jgi:hypothetical protein
MRYMPLIIFFYSLCAITVTVQSWRRLLPCRSPDTALSPSSGLVRVLGHVCLSQACSRCSGTRGRGGGQGGAGACPPPPTPQGSTRLKKKLVIQLKKSKNDENSKILAQIDCLAALITDCPPTLESWLRRAVRVGSAAEI